MAAAGKLLLFHLKTSKSNGELQQLVQGKVPSQAAKWVRQPKSPWSTQHPVQALKSCGNLAGRHLGDSKSNRGEDDRHCLRRLRCNAAWAAGAARHGLARTSREGFPHASPGEPAKDQAQPCFKTPVENQMGKRNLPGGPGSGRSQVAFGNRQVSWLI